MLQIAEVFRMVTAGERPAQTDAFVLRLGCAVAERSSHQLVFAVVIC